jgi:hypothetical protein
MNVLNKHRLFLLSLMQIRKSRNEIHVQGLYHFWEEPQGLSEWNLGNVGVTTHHSYTLWVPVTDSTNPVHEYHFYTYFALKL